MPGHQGFHGRVHALLHDHGLTQTQGRLLYIALNPHIKHARPLACAAGKVVVHIHHTDRWFVRPFLAVRILHPTCLGKFAHNALSSWHLETCPCHNQHIRWQGLESSGPTWRWVRHLIFALECIAESIFCLDTARCHVQVANLLPLPLLSFPRTRLCHGLRHIRLVRISDPQQIAFHTCSHMLCSVVFAIIQHDIHFHTPNSARTKPSRCAELICHFTLFAPYGFAPAQCL